jgi:hypothetical protein
VRVDASGNVGIGTSSPAQALDVSGNINVSGTGTSNFTSTATSPVQINGASIPTLTIRNSATPVETQIRSTTTEGLVRTVTDHPLVFGTDAVEAMRIDTSGNLLVGTTSNPNNRRLMVSGGVSGNYMTQIQNTLTSGTPYGLQITLDFAPNNTDQSFLFCGDSSATRLAVRANGGIENFSGNNVNLSDRREKTNFAPAKSYLETICAIPVQTLNYIDQNHEEDPGLTLGVVAQDVQEVAPELVMESNWGTAEEPKMRLSVYQTDLQYALMKCIQEQQAIITALTARVEALEGAQA